VQRITLFLAVVASLCAAPNTYELRGSIVPASPASVSLFGATTPFHAETVANELGSFRFRALLPGQYTVAIFLPGRGEVRQTVEIGPRTADSKGRLSVTIHAGDSHLVSGEVLEDFSKVSKSELSIPDSARHEYEEAGKKLAHRDVAAASAHLENAVRIAPQFTAAWNTLGTIAYQTQQYAKAESHFRKALNGNPAAYEPLVNLGGTLLSENKAREALPYNRDAVRSRPNDALSNAQLGMNYAMLGNLDLGQQYLEIAKRIDPGHFSYPQLTLARIHLQRHERAAAAAELRDFLERHPDSPRAAQVREQLQQLRGY
jgi:tetratricopeptide (TPR) repeat protein